jgi:hypothetical protein
MSKSPRETVDGQASERTTTHTPGPWRIGDAANTIFGPPNGNPSPETVATLAPTPRRRANARLIQAAPDLLAAAQQALDLLDDCAVRHFISTKLGEQAQLHRALNALRKVVREVWSVQP